jgi:hypothetical protein
MPKFNVTDRAEPRFIGDFAVVVANGYTATQVEAQYLQRLNELLIFLADEEDDDQAEDFQQSVLEARRRQRADAAALVRSEAEQVSNDELIAENAEKNLPVIKGMYQALRDRLKRTLFAVTVAPGKDADAGYSVDLAITIRGGLPPQNDVPSPEKQELFAQLNGACKVIRTVCQRMNERTTGWYRTKADEKAQDRARRLRDEYITKLAGIGHIGLEGDHTGLAKLALNELKNEFVAQEAGRIKNAYVKWLGFWAALAASIFLGAWIWIAADASSSNWLLVHRSFLLAAAGAAVGTWVSFSARRVVLSFDQLMMLEEGALDPPLRILFVIALTTTACLLFWTGAMNIEIGQLKTNSAEFQRGGSIAFLIGLFGGLSERALATAISGRAAAFVKGIGI